MPSVLADIFALAAKIPLAFIPGLTWAVVAWAALGVYQMLGFRIFGADYVIAPILLTYIIYLAWKRDSWGGLAGAVLGVVIALAGGLLFSNIIGNAVGLLGQWLWLLLSSTAAGLIGFVLMAFTFGLLIGFAATISLESMLLALIISAVQAFLIYAWMSYFQGLLLTSAYRAVHRITHDLPPGVHVLAGIGAAATLGALDVYASLAFILTIGAYTLGMWIGSAAAMAMYPWLGLIRSAVGGFIIVSDLIMKGIAIATSKLEHMGVVMGFLSMIVFHLLGIASVGLAWLAATSLLFSRRRGHAAYSAMAAAMLAAVVAKLITVA